MLWSSHVSSKALLHTTPESVDETLLVSTAVMTTTAPIHLPAKPLEALGQLIHDY